VARGQDCGVAEHDDDRRETEPRPTISERREREAAAEADPGREREVVPRSHRLRRALEKEERHDAREHGSADSRNAGHQGEAREPGEVDRPPHHEGKRDDQRIDVGHEDPSLPLQVLPRGAREHPRGEDHVARSDELVPLHQDRQGREQERREDDPASREKQRQASNASTIGPRQSDPGRNRPRREPRILDSTGHADERERDPELRPGAFVPRDHGTVRREHGEEDHERVRVRPVRFEDVNRRERQSGRREETRSCSDEPARERVESGDRRGRERDRQQTSDEVEERQVGRGREWRAGQLRPDEGRAGDEVRESRRMDQFLGEPLATDEEPPRRTREEHVGVEEDEVRQAPIDVVRAQAHARDEDQKEPGAPTRRRHLVRRSERSGRGEHARADYHRRFTRDRRDLARLTASTSSFREEAF